MSTTPPDQQKTANDIGEITCLSIPKVKRFPDIGDKSEREGSF
jgi:hypothetical protein